MNRSDHFHNGTPRVGGELRHGPHCNGMRDERGALYGCICNRELQALGTGNDIPDEPLVTTKHNETSNSGAVTTQELHHFSEAPNYPADTLAMSYHRHNKGIGVYQDYTPFFGQEEIYPQQTSLPTSELKAPSLNIPNHQANIYDRSSYPQSERMVRTGIPPKGKDDGRDGARGCENKYRSSLKSSFKVLKSSVDNSKRALGLNLDPPLASRPIILASAARLLNDLTVTVQEQAKIIQDLRRSQVPSTTFYWDAEEAYG